jgi:hypothetical protein
VLCREEGHPQTEGTITKVDLTEHKDDFESRSWNGFAAPDSSTQARPAMMLAIMLKVLPRPIPSARMPPRISSGIGLFEPVMTCLYLAPISVLAVAANGAGASFGSVNPLINCSNGLLKAEGPLYSIYRVRLAI